MSFKMAISIGDKIIVHHSEPSDTILYALRQHDININAACGGNGTCGKCKVGVRKEQGGPVEYVLACTTKIESDLEIFVSEEQAKSAKSVTTKAKHVGDVGVAFDFGTTNVAGFLVDLNSGNSIDSYSMLNPQRKYGADVITRISNQKNFGKELQKESIDCVNSIIQQLCRTNGIPTSQIHKVAVAGNTIMLHFIMGLSAESLATAPFTPVTTDVHVHAPGELGVDISPNGKITILPAVSAYVGADTLVAVLSSGMHRKEEISLLADIGTNGEIVLGNKDWMYASSTAAGPAFEYNDKGLRGSEVIDELARLLRQGSVLPSGRLQEESASVLTQDDIRQIQNAKAAIMAGINILLKASTIKEEDVARLYLAGSFGSFINIHNAVEIGLIHESMAPKVILLGNAAGEGAARALASEEALNELLRLRKAIKTVELSSREDFNEEYVNCMIFKRG